MTRICPICHYEFEPDEDNIRYCSNSCRRRAAEKLAAAVRKNADAQKPKRKAAAIDPAFDALLPSQKQKSAADPVMRTCKQCGKAFRALRNQAYCSAECRASAYRASWAESKRRQRAAIAPKPAVEQKAAQEKAPEPKPTPKAPQATCPECGQEFVRRSGVQRFCTPSCREAAAAKKAKPVKPAFERVCPECGEAFTTVNRKQVYCSRKCLRKAIDRRHRLKILEAHGPVMRICQACGKGFRAKRNERYCSEACRLAAQTENRRAYQRVWARAHYAPKAARERTCLVCGKTFSAKGNTCYCSAECRGAALRRQKRDYFRRTYKPAGPMAEMRDAAAFEALVAAKLATYQEDAESLLKRARIEVEEELG